MKSYLIEAVYKYITDNNLSPYIAVHVDYPGVLIPSAYVVNGQIVLNLKPSAIRHLYMGKDRISFETSFNQQPHAIEVPIGAIIGIYAKETGQGLLFDIDEISSNIEQQNNEPKSNKPKLTIVK